MRDCSSLKQEFLKKWIKGLKACKSSWINSNKEMTILERKKAIKLSADVAMASARNGATFWSRAVIANAAQNNKDDAVEASSSSSRWASSVMHKKIVKKSRSRSRSRRRVGRSRRSGLIKKRRVHVHDDVAETGLIAKRLLVKKKTQVLKSLVPGGELMDEVALIGEALDYIVSLRAQVDVMRCVATTSHQLIISIGK